jgi:cell division protein FtsI (penicillin-binding protein 3)
MTISYGHGIAVSPLHLVGAVASMVNGGIRMPITLLKGRNAGVQGTRIISEKTSRNMRRLLRLVVEKGTGRKAAAKGYLVGGKTGTSDKPGKNGRYQDKSLLSSFVASFPMSDPRYVVFAMVDEPKGIKESHGYATGGWVAAPVVRRVIERIAPLLGIHAVDEKATKFRRDLGIELPKPKAKQGKKKLASF